MQRNLLRVCEHKQTLVVASKLCMILELSVNMIMYAIMMRETSVGNGLIISIHNISWYLVLLLMILKLYTLKSKLVAVKGASLLESDCKDHPFEIEMLMCRFMYSILV